MHKTFISHIRSSITATIAALGILVAVKLDSRPPRVAVKAIVGAIVSVKLLALAPMTVGPESFPQVQITFVETVPVAPDVWVSNFITSDGQYFLLADGRVLFVKGE